jgi:hypothetical protein
MANIKTRFNPLQPVQFVDEAGTKRTEKVQVIEAQALANGSLWVIYGVGEDFMKPDSLEWVSERKILKDRKYFTDGQEE